MAPILLSAPNNKPWTFGRHLEVALQETGRDVTLFDFRNVRRPNEGVIEAAQRLRPRLHIVWKGEDYRPETFRRLAALGVYNVLWHPDISVPRWLPPLARESDLCCVQSAGMFEAFRKAGIEDPQWLMEGITPSCFAYREISPAEQAKYTCDVVLVGTVSYKRKRMAYLNRLVQEGVRVKWWGRRLGFRLTRLRDWLSPGRRAWGGDYVWNDRYAKACHCAKIFLALPSHPEVPGGLSNRALIATGLGTFYLSLYRKGMEEFFDLGKEVVTFRDEDEMMRKVRYYLMHNVERREIAAAGQRRALGNYTNQHAFKRLFRMIAARGGPEA